MSNKSYEHRTIGTKLIAISYNANKRKTTIDNTAAIRIIAAREKS